MMPEARSPTLGLALGGNNPDPRPVTASRLSVKRTAARFPPQVFEERSAKRRQQPPPTPTVQRRHHLHHKLPSIRRAGRIRRPGTGHDIGSLRRQRTRPRTTTRCQLHARLFARPARYPARRSGMAVDESPSFARDRDVAPSALAARRPHTRTIAARHVQHLPVPPQTPDASSRDAPRGASGCGRPYHAVITTA